MPEPYRSCIPIVDRRGSMVRGLRGLGELARAGFKVGLTVAPIQPVDDWRAGYAALFADNPLAGVRFRAPPPPPPVPSAPGRESGSAPVPGVPEASAPTEISGSDERSSRDPLGRRPYSVQQRQKKVEP